MRGWTFHTLAKANMATLEKVFRAGQAPLLPELVDWEYRGWNVLPAYGKPIFWLMSNLRFIKVFYQQESDPDVHEADHIRGYNLAVTRGGLHSPWTCRPSDTAPLKQGFYNVYPPGGSPRAREYAHATFLDYFLERNNLFTGKYLEDYLVMPNPDDPSLLLGKAYLVLGPARFGGFFVLERLQRRRTPATA